MHPRFDVILDVASAHKPRLYASVIFQTHLCGRNVTPTLSLLAKEPSAVSVLLGS